MLSREQRRPPQQGPTTVGSQACVSRAQPAPLAHAPATQMSPSQHSMSRSQRLPRATHSHSPSWHSIRPQQSSLVSQAVPPPAQHWRTGGAVGSARVSLHASPSQQSAELVHVAPVSVHMVSAGRHMKVRQVNPSQHSLESRQKLPSRLQEQVPPDPHDISPQQSREFSQLPPSPMQQRGTSGAGRHTEPAQHSWPGKRPPSRQVRLGPRQVEQSPNWQCSDPSQLLIEPPRSQHICPSRPQSAGVIAQRPDGSVRRSHTRPGSQPPRGPQGAPSKPLSVERRQVPPRHTSSPEHSLGVPPAPGQQARSISPHAVAGSAFTHVPVVTSQASEPTHEVAPSQQACPSSPHAPQVPSVQTSPERQVNPGQHVRPAMPQSAEPGGRSSSGLTHAPATQARPMQQSLEPEHDAVRGAQQAPP